MSDSGWVVREACEAEHGLLLSWWLRALREHRPPSAGRIDDKPLLRAFLAASEVRVACDPARSTDAPGAPVVIWAWSCATPSLVGWVGVKRAAMTLLGGEMCREMVDDLLGATRVPLATLYDLEDLRAIAAVDPSTLHPWRRWTVDRDAWRTLQTLAAPTTERARDMALILSRVQR